MALRKEGDKREMDWDRKGRKRRIALTWNGKGKMVGGKRRKWEALKGKGGVGREAKYKEKFESRLCSFFYPGKRER